MNCKERSFATVCASCLLSSTEQMDLRQHLLSRHFNLDLHRTLLDEELGVASFLLYNLSGQLVGYQQYNPRGDKKVFNNKLGGKYYTYRKQPTVCVWGVESLYQSTGPVFLTEGVFDACRMTERGVGQTAFATLANDPPRDYRNWLRSLHRSVVVVCDNDAAGRKLAKFGDFVEVVPEGKDLGEASDDYVRYLVEKYATLQTGY